MKLKVLIGSVCCMAILFFGACKKTAGPGGKNAISGTVVFKNGVSGTNDLAALATVSIAYGTNESTASFNQTILTDEDGKFIFDGLNKGNYFIKAAFTDSHGFNYTGNGAGISINNNKNKVIADLILE
jgi:hypothetical protein